MGKGWDNGYIKRGVYDRASELTGIEKIELQKYVYVCKSIKSLLRNKDLSFTHHKEVAKLETKDQEYFLNEVKIPGNTRHATLLNLWLHISVSKQRSEGDWTVGITDIRRF